MRTEISMLRMLVFGTLLAAGSAVAQAPPPPEPPAAPTPPPPPTRVEGDKISLGKNVTVPKGEIREGDIAHVGGNLRVEGEVRGDVGVVGGNLTIESGGIIDGDAAVAGGNLVLNEGSLVRGEVAVKGGKIVNNGGRVVGEMRTEEGYRGPSAAAVREQRRDRAQQPWYRPITRGFAGIVSTLAIGLVLAGVGAGLIFYGLPYLQTVSDTIRVSTLRSAAVGLAAMFLVIPAYLVLLVLLAVSIIGIPVIIVAAPLYPVAVIVAVGFGLIAAAHAIGERTAEQRTPTDIRYRNAYAYLFGGVGLLIAPMLVGYLVGMTGFLGFVRMLLLILGWAGVGTAAMVGLGAVVLSRAGTRRFFAERFDDALFEPDPLLDNEPAGLGRHA